MNFLTDQDLETEIFQEFIDIDDPEEQQVINKIERQTIALVKSKLRLRFKIDELFNATGDDRHDLLVWYVSAIVVYRMISRNKARKIPKDVSDIKEKAMMWLNDVRNGDETPDFPKVETNNGEQIYHGNATNNDWYL